MIKKKYFLWIAAAFLLAAGTSQIILLQQHAKTDKKTSPTLIELKALVQTNHKPTNIVIIGDSYSQSPGRWVRPMALHLTQNLGRAVGGWIGYGFYRASDTTFTDGLQPTGTDMSAMKDNWIGYYGHWISAYKKTVCPDLSGASTDTIGAKLVRNLPKLTAPSNLVVSYIAHEGSSVLLVSTDEYTREISLLADKEGTLGTFEIPLKATTKQVTIEALSDTVQLCGDVIEDGSTGVRVHKIAASGSAVKQWVNIPRSVQIQSLEALEPTLYIVMLGTNSHIFNIPPKDWANDMRELLSRMESAAPQAPILIVMPPQNMLMDKTYKISDYTSEAQTIATEKSLAFLDLQPFFGANPDDYSASSANPLFAEDGIHPNIDRGGPVIAKAIYQALGE